MIKARNLFTFPNKNTCLLFLCNLLFVSIHAQSLAGITNKRDTSYTTYSAYKYSKADNPNIKVVGDFNYNDVDIKKNITYCSIGDRNLMIDAFTPKQSSAKR